MIEQKGAKGFDGIRAQSLWCPKCGKARPVRDKLLLVLPDGEKHAYICVVCGERLATRTVK